LMGRAETHTVTFPEERASPIVGWPPNVLTTRGPVDSDGGDSK